MPNETRTTETAQWLTSHELQALGFVPAGPEIDYGMRWGAQREIRVSWAPHRDMDGGYLYARNAATDEYLLLAQQTSPDQVDAAWRELNVCATSPDAYLRLSVLDRADSAMAVEAARALLVHCVDRELAACRAYADLDQQSDARFSAAHSVVIQRSARVAAEAVLIGAVRAEGDPVITRYRLLEDREWSGRIAARDLGGVATEVRQVLDVAAARGFTAQATSVTQAHTTLSAARVPELQFAAARPALALDAPVIGI